MKRVGRYYTLHEHDSVRIDPARNCYWQNSVAGRNGIGEGGSVIDFAQRFVHNGDLHLALKELTARVSGGAAPVENNIRKSEMINQEPRELKLPKRGKDMHRVYAYLTQTRCIDQDIVQDFVNRRILYQDVKGNCVFVSRDQEGKPVFANFRGTLSNKRFLGDVPGSDYSKGFYISNGADKLILTESVIDAMSVMSILHGQGVDYKQYDYMPLSGATKQEAIIRHLQEKPMREILLALDHDVAGVKNMQGIHDRLLDSSVLNLSEGQVTYHVPAEMDWNADLVSKAGRFLPLSDLKFLDAGELPAIHYCAVQSTADFEERGFHKRNGKDQFRLVELAGSEIQAMDIKKNVIFRSPEEVKKLIPNMYEEIPYVDLLKMRESQIEVKKDGQKMTVQKEERIPEKETSVSGRIREFTVSDNLITAVLSQSGQEETLWREEGRTYYATGEMYDNTYQEHDLTEAEADAFENYLTENGIELDERSPMLMRKENTESTAINGKQNGTSFLDKLQEQQMKQEKDIVPMPEISIGIGS